MQRRNHCTRCPTKQAIYRYWCHAKTNEPKELYSRFMLSSPRNERHRNCVVKALTRKVHNILSNSSGKEDMLYTFYDHLGKGVVIVDDITKLVKVATTTLKLPQKGFLVARVGSYSLWAGGAVRSPGNQRRI